MEKTVSATSEMLPELKQAGVVDAGALGMFIFLEAFLGCLTDRMDDSRPVTEIFAGQAQNSLRLESAGDEIRLLRQRHDPDDQGSAGGSPPPPGRGESMVVTEDADGLKVHLHTASRGALRSGLEAIGQVVDWSEESIVTYAQVGRGPPRAHHDRCCRFDHGGGCPSWASRCLNSYLVVGEQVLSGNPLRP
jgi:uncharacterized protein